MHEADSANRPKRKLSVSASAKEDNKKSKTQSDTEDGAIDEGSDEGDDEELDEEDGGEDDDDDDDDDDDPAKPNEKAYPLVGPGPHTFYLWADGISSLIEMADDQQYVVLKSAALDAFKPVASLPEDEQTDAIVEHLDILRTWFIEATDEAREASGAQALVAKWNDGSFKRKDEEDADKDEEDEDKDDDEGGEGVQWWYEVVLQQKRPAEDSPHIEVTLEDAGIWYLTDIKAADKEGGAAMSVIVNHTANTYD